MSAVLRRAMATAGLVLGVGAAVVVHPQSYPNRPIRFIVPYAPGGGADIVARAIGQRLTEASTVPVVIDNRPGGGTIIGTELAARSAPDGYTLFMATGAHTSNPSLYRKLPYDTEKAFSAVTLAASSPFLVVVNASFPANSLRELIDQAKTRKLSYGISATGAPDHLGTELLKSLLNLDMVRVPYRGAGPALTALIGGEIQVMFCNILAAVPLVKTGKIRALAATTLARSALLPELPTVAESGLPGFDVSAWSGVLVPAGTPRTTVNWLADEIRKGLNHPDVKDRLNRLGAGLVGSTPEHFSEFLARDTEKWSRVIRHAGIEPND